VGEHAKVIQGRLGHASIKPTLDTYGHLLEGLDEAAAERLDKVWHSAAVDATWRRRDREVVEFPGRQPNPLAGGACRMNVGVLAFWGGFGDYGRLVNVRCVERDQLLLMPPSLSDWLAAGSSGLVDC